jgi:hypothetical protein
VTRSRRKIVLVSGLEDMDQALFIAQRVEAFLGIADRPATDEDSW